MAVSRRLRSLAWLAFPLATLALLFWANRARVERVEFVSALALEPLRVDPRSATGWVGGIRRLVVPGQNPASQQWIAQTQQMFARGEARVRSIEFENAPEGRPVDAPSLYRWWLGALSDGRHRLSGEPIGATVEAAALWSDPLLHVLLVMGATGFVAWRFGWFAAAVVCLGLTFTYPLAANFVPGAPDDHGLALILAVASVLPLVAGVALLRQPSAGGPATAGDDNTAAGSRLLPWFIAAGVFGGIGLWVSVSVQLPMLLGCALGALGAAWALRRAAGDSVSAAANVVLPWRSWALAGASTTLAAYLVEFAPDHLGAWHVRVVHPLHALAWLGVGEVLTLATGWIQRRRVPPRWRGSFALAGAIAAVTALVWVARMPENGGLLAADPAVFRLTRLTGDSAAPHLLRWLVQPGVEGKLLALFSPLLLAFPAAWALLTRKLAAPERAVLLVAFGPVLVALAFAGWQLSWWSLLNALLCVLAAAAVPVITASEPARSRWIWLAVTAPCVVAGLVRLAALTENAETRSLDEAELLGLVHRDLAHWLAKRTGPEGAIVLAPPAETAALAYYGGLQGIGTLSWENQKGLMATVRILSATTRQEAEALITRRRVTHVILPSWDAHFREYARVGSGQVEGTFFDELQHLNMPPWLRPVAYAFPTIAGFENQSVTVLEVVDEQDEATALARTAVYFLEIGRMEFAAAAGEALRRFPSNLGAWIARAEVESARGDRDGLEASLKYLLPRLQAGADRSLPLDRRVGLAVVLARAQRDALAREQVRRCLAQADEPRLRSLSTGTLYRLLALAKHHELEFADRRLREFGLELLPADLRARVVP